VVFHQLSFHKTFHEGKRETKEKEKRRKKRKEGLFVKFITSPVIWKYGLGSILSRKGQKKSSRFKNRRQERVRERARNPLSVSLSWEDATKALLRARASASVCRLAHGGEKRGQSVIQFFFFEIFKERVKNTRTNERKRVVFFIEKKEEKRGVKVLHSNSFS
jgi:hypothetical protein